MFLLQVVVLRLITQVSQQSVSGAPASDESVENPAANFEAPAAEGARVLREVHIQKGGAHPENHGGKGSKSG